MKLRIELPQGVNPEHFAATYSFQDFEDVAVFEYEGTSFTKRDFERLLTKLEADSGTQLLWYEIENGQRVELRSVDWEQGDEAV